MPERIRLSRWLLALAAWLPPCFALWYWSANLPDPLVASVSLALVNALANGVATQVETGSDVITFVTRIAVGAGVMTIDVQSRLYSFGLPLGLAVLLASRPVGLAWKLPVLALAQLAVVAWGVSFDALAHLVRSAPSDWTAANFCQSGATLVAVGYQFASLVFPALVPTALAVGLSWERLREGI
jgi:hypothetical protein